MFNIKLQLSISLVLISIIFGEKCDDIKFDIDKGMVEKYDYEYCSSKMYKKEGFGNMTFVETAFTGCSGDVMIRAHGLILERLPKTFTPGAKKTELIQTSVEDGAEFRICAKGSGCSTIEGKVCQIN